MVGATVLMMGAWASPAAAVNVRRDVYSLTAAQLKTLANGVKAMKKKPASDPTSWASQTFDITAVARALKAFDRWSDGGDVTVTLIPHRAAECHGGADRRREGAARGQVRTDLADRRVSGATRRR